jgi:eukaryotic-like serine/threonine-protein kinase
MNRSYTISISIPVRTFWRVVVPAAAGVLLGGGLLGVLVVDRLIMPQVVGLNKGIVDVPTVAGVGYEEARELLFRAGLLCNVRDEEFSDSVPPGTVIRQYIGVGEKVKRGRQIDVALSRGPRVGVVPDVRGIAEHIARLELRKKGFTPGRGRREYDEKVPADAVINTKPEVGTSISREMDVEIVVSKGPKPTSAEMVNVVGEALGEAQAKIADAGLKVGRVDYQNNSSLTPGTVTSQSVPPGTAVPLESAVDLVVSVRK